MIIPRTLRPLSDRSSTVAAAMLRRAGDAAHRLADRLAPPASPAPSPIVEHLIDAFAAAIPLPAAPPRHGDAETDVANLITYQSALVEHAKRAEQFRALAALVAHLPR